MSSLFQQLLELPNILFIVFFAFTSRILYASSHFSGSSTTTPKVLKMIGVIYTLFSWFYLIVIAVKISIPLAIILFVVGSLILFFLSSYRNKIVFSSVRNKNPGLDKMYISALAEHKSNVIIVLIAYLGCILSIPILIYLIPYTIGLLK